MIHEAQFKSLTANAKRSSCEHRKKN